MMELHTLGVKGGYTQAGRDRSGALLHRLDRPQSGPIRNSSSRRSCTISARRPCWGTRSPAGGGEQDGLQVIDILAHHPSTAKFISRELAQRFVADDPPQALVDRMAQTFMKTDGDLRAVMETMFTSPEFFSEGAWQAKVKSPLRNGGERGARHGRRSLGRLHAGAEDRRFGRAALRQTGADRLSRTPAKRG